MKKRLLRFIKYLGIGQNKFAQIVGLSSGYMSTVGENITVKTIDKICAIYTKLNKDWLLTGEGEMIKTSDNVHEINNNGDSNINIAGHVTNSQINRYKEENQTLKARIKELEDIIQELREDKRFLQKLLDKNK